MVEVLVLFEIIIIIIIVKNWRNKEKRTFRNLLLITAVIALFIPIIPNLNGIFSQSSEVGDHLLETYDDDMDLLRDYRFSNGELTLIFESEISKMNDNVIYTILITDLAFKADTNNELTSIKTEMYIEPYEDMEKPSLSYKYSKDTYNDIGSDRFTDVLGKEWLVYERADDFGFSTSALVYMNDELFEKLVDVGIQYIE